MQVIDVLCKRLLYKGLNFSYSFFYPFDHLMQSIIYWDANQIAAYAKTARFIKRILIKGFKGVFSLQKT